MLRIESKLSPEVEQIIHRTIGCCIDVHRSLGPGLLEPVYQRAVGIELKVVGLNFEREKAIPIFYREQRIYEHRLDFVVEDVLLLELKAVERTHPVHHAQVISCLRASKLKVGLLINFNVPLLPDGVKRFVL